MPAQGSPAIAHVVLTGFMGAGKSTVGPLLAALLGWRFLDVDSVIVEAQGRSVAEIFHADGEAFFRELEHQAIVTLLHEPYAVLALGGGALEHPGTLRRLTTDPHSRLVFLQTPLAVALARCGAGSPHAASRPLLAAPAELQARYSARLPRYRQAHHTLDTSEHSPAQLAEAIAAWLRPQLDSRV